MKFEKTKTQNKAIVNISWLDKNGSQQGNLNFGYDYSVLNKLCSEKNDSSRVLRIPLKNFNIDCRYVIVEIDFTLHPFIASKN